MTNGNILSRLIACHAANEVQLAINHALIIVKTWSQNSHFSI